jgi:hypothetical protein
MSTIIDKGGVPEFMHPVVGEEPPASAQDVAERAVLALNESMILLYEQSLTKFKQNMRDRVPIILALFTGEGGQMILYRPGQEAEVAPPVPIVYQIAKSVGHSTMAIYEIVSPYLSNAYANQLWRPPLEMYWTQNHTALNNLGALDISEDVRSILSEILERNLAFMDECIANGGYSYREVEKYIRDTVPHSIKTIGVGSGAQVGHYSVLVQFMGTETMGDRLLLVETPDFETTPEKMLDVLGRIVADRSLGMVFFRDYFLMDVELLGGGGREAIKREMAERGKEAVLPTLAPFRSNDWPWKTDPAKGTGPARMEDVH